MKNKIISLEEYAKINNVPIILKDGLNFLLDFIKTNNIKSILEIGCAIGYSAINFALCDASVTTIERDEKMYNKALENIKDFNLEDKVKVIFGDAKDVSHLITERYDMIFIDAAKGSYKTFFDLYADKLTDNGYIVCDNMDFHGLTSLDVDLSSYSRGLRSMIKKINSFKEFLLHNDNYLTSYHHIGDGITISRKV